MKKTTIWCGLAVAATASAWAGNGNMLHGFGPINSSMGGAGAGIWVDDPIGALMFNPALMSASSGNHVSFGTEFFWDDPQFEVTLTNPDGRSGKADPSTEPGILPSFGFTHHNPESAWSFGFGLVGIAGFRTDNGESNDSILFALPQNGGFGRIYTDHRVTKVPLAVSYQVTDKLSLGVALNTYIAELAIAPLPYQVQDIVFPPYPAGPIPIPNPPPPFIGYYPQGDGLVKSYAISVQPSFYYQATDRISIGGSLTTEQDFDHFEWNSTFANPFSPNFGQARKLKYDLDGPLIVTLGAGVELPDDKTKVALDVSWIKYDGVAGFGSPGGIVNGVVQPFGWDNVWAFKLGVEHKLTDKVTLRGGYNFSENPIPDKNTLTGTGAPAFFQHHISGGIGVQVTDSLTANAGFYWVPRSTNEGPYLAPQGPPGNSPGNDVIGKIESSNRLLSGQIGLSWTF